MSDNLTKKIFFNINWILIEKVSKGVLTALTSIIVARYLGAEGLGAISIALTLYSIFSVIGTLGLERVVLKELESPECHPEKLMGGVILLRIIGAIVAFIVVNISVVYFYAGNLKLQYMILMLSFAFFIAIGNTFEVFYRKQLRSKNVTIVRVFGLFISAITKIIIVFLSLDVVWFTLPLLIETTIISISFLYLRFNDEQLTLGKLEYQLGEAKRLIHFSWPLLLSGLAGSLYFQIDKILIHQYMDDTALGRYALIFQMVSILLLMLNAINLSVTPVLNKLYFNNRKEYWNKFKEVTALKFCLAISLGFGLALLGNIVIQFVVGEDYFYSQEVLWAFSIYIMLVSITSLNTEYCILAGVVRPLFYLRILTLLLNFTLNLYFIPIWGLYGAACATVVSFFFHKFIFPLLVKDMRVIVWNNVLALSYLFRKELYINVGIRFTKILLGNKPS